MARVAMRTLRCACSLKILETQFREYRVPVSASPCVWYRKSATLIDMRYMPSIIQPQFPGLALAALLLTGCASYSAHQHAGSLTLAQQDDAACQAQGWRYPEPHYVTCRMYLQDARLHKDWMNLQLMHQTQVQPTGIPQPYPYKETYRPLDPDHFSCHLVHEAGRDYVLCDEDDDATPGPRD
jgi:hypothetical protein